MELETLRRSAKSHRDDLIIQLGGYVGLRAFEIPQIQPRHIKRTDDGAHYHLRVPEGKDTKYGTGMPRDGCLPSDFELGSLRIRTPAQRCPSRTLAAVNTGSQVVLNGGA